jgi:hypothetical protein
MSYHHTWAEARVCFQHSPGRLRSLPVGWTSLAPPDPFVIQAGGRSWFRVEDLLELAHLVKMQEHEL